MKPFHISEPQEAEVRTFRGMISGTARGLFSGLRKAGAKASRFVKGLFGRKRKRLRRRPPIKLRAPMKNKLLLTGKRPPMLMPAQVSSWNTKLLSWNWRQFVKLKSKANLFFTFIAISVNRTFHQTG